MATPQPHGHRPLPVAKRRSRAAGIVLAVTGFLLLPCVFVLPWYGRGEFTWTLWQIRSDFRQPFLPLGEQLSYVLPVYLVLAAAVVALLTGVVVIVLGNRPANLVGALLGLVSSLLAFAAVAHFFFRAEGYNGLPRFFTEFVNVAYYGTWLLSLLLLVAVILALVGAIRAGRPRQRPPAPYPQAPYPQAPYPQHASAPYPHPGGNPQQQPGHYPTPPPTQGPLPAQGPPPGQA